MTTKAQQLIQRFKHLELNASQSAAINLLGLQRPLARPYNGLAMCNDHPDSPVRFEFVDKGYYLYMKRDLQKLGIL